MPSTVASIIDEMRKVVGRAATVPPPLSRTLTEPQVAPVPQQRWPFVVPFDGQVPWHGAACDDAVLSSLLS